MWDHLEIGKVLKRQVRDKNQKLIMKAFMLESFIAKGQDWRVMTVTDLQTMKRGTLKMIMKSESMVKQRKDQIFKQIQNQKKMSGRHNFIDLYEVFEDNSTIYLLMQKWGTPLESIVERRLTLMQKEVQLIFCQMVDIMQSLKSSNITHGNINLSSVLLAQNQRNQLQLTNFSNSQDLSILESYGTDRGNNKSNFGEMMKEDKENLQKRMSGTQSDKLEDYSRIKCGNIELSEYTSPEEYHHEHEYNKINLIDRDIWSCGVLLFRLLTGTFPFSDQNGKLIPNKIKNATFSFPKLESVSDHFPNFSEINFKSKFHNQFLSLQWRELLKKMISHKNQRISIKQLLNHPFRQQYYQLKLIPNLKCSQPRLSNLISQKKTTQSIYQRAWKVNFQNDEQDSQSETDCSESIPFSQSESKTSKQQLVKVNIPKVPIRESMRQNSSSEYIKDKGEVKGTKMFRIHKTHYNPVADSIHVLQNPRHQTVGNPLKQKQKPKKYREQSLIVPVTCKNSDVSSEKEKPVATQPIFLVKFRYFKKGKWLGYILNNSVGVVFEDGQHIVGHSQNDYKYIEEVSELQSEILVDNAYSINYNQPQASKNILKNQPRFTPNQSFLNSQESLKMTYLRNFKSEQVSNTDIGNQFSVFAKTKNVTQSRVGPSLLQYNRSNNLAKDKLQIYNRALQFFGERVVLGSLDLWVDKFWRDGNIYIFLLNTGCWQVAFLEKKGFRIYAIDQNELSWFKNKTDSPEINYSVREIIKKYQSLIKKRQNQGKMV